MNIVITGASKGIGKAIGEKFAANGYSVFLCARHEESLKETVAGIRSKNPAVEVHYKTCDVSIKAEVKAFADWVLSKAGTIDVLINNAGIICDTSITDLGNTTALRATLETNVLGADFVLVRLSV